jgi:hypothetical protein
VKICPHGAVNLNLRVPGKEIWEMRHTNTGTAFLIIGMIGGLISEMVSKMPIYSRLTADIPLPEIGKFSLVFFAILIIVNLLLALSASLSKNFFGDTFNENFSRYGLALLPITLTGFTAFHVYYLINWGVQLPILVSNTFQFEIFKQLIITVPPDVTHFIQKILLWIGLAWSLMIIYKLGRSSDESFGRAIIGILPHSILACLLTAALQTAITHFFYPVTSTI